MVSEEGKEARDRREEFGREVAKKEARKLKAELEGDRGVWFGLGMFGLVGWSVAIPTLAFTALGVWLDSAWPREFSWTLTMLVIGVALGCLNAWMWVKRELRKR